MFSKVISLTSRNSIYKKKKNKNKQEILKEEMTAYLERRGWAEWTAVALSSLFVEIMSPTRN